MTSDIAIDDLDPVITFHDSTLESADTTAIFRWHYP